MDACSSEGRVVSGDGGGSGGRRWRAAGRVHGPRAGVRCFCGGGERGGTARAKPPGRGSRLGLLPSHITRHIHTLHLTHHLTLTISHTPSHTPPHTISPTPLFRLSPAGAWRRARTRPQMLQAGVRDDSRRAAGPGRCRWSAAVVRQQLHGPNTPPSSDRTRHATLAAAYSRAASSAAAS